MGKMLSMNKGLVFMLLFFFISGLFVPVFNPVSVASELVADSWNTKKPMRQARDGFGVVVVDGQIYVIGGSYETEVPSYDNYPLFVTNYVGANERYDPASDTWVTLEPMPTPRANFAIVEYEGKIYCIGGRPFTNPAIIEVYDPVTNCWSAKESSLFMELRGVHGHVADGKIFVKNGSYDLFMYDPVKNSWIEKAQIPSMGQPFSTISTVFDDKILVVHLVESDWPYSDPSYMKVAIYDPKSDSLIEGNAKVELYGAPNTIGATTGVYAPKKVYVSGYIFKITDPHGSQNSVPSLFMYVYDPISDVWSIAKANSLGSVCVVDDILYVIGSTTTEQYVPIGYNPFGYQTSSTTTSVASKDTSFSGSSESKPLWTFLTGTIVVIIVLVVSVVVIMTSFFYLKRKTIKITAIA